MVHDTISGHSAIQADVVFVVEATAMNGAYLNELKANYIVSSLEYFNQAPIEDREFMCESCANYGLVLYEASDCRPRPYSTSYGHWTNPQKILNLFDKMELVGGKGEGFANIAEGLATALVYFEDLQSLRESTCVPHKHCILVCNSPPYSVPVMQCSLYAGQTLEQLATVFCERNIHLSILSPRKIPALIKLFEKAGGDVQLSQTKNYAKDPRHLVLLKGYNLKERPMSPAPVGAPAIPAPPTSLPVASMPSPLSSNVGSPQTQGPNFRPGPPQQNPNIPTSNQQPVAPQAAAVTAATQQQQQQTQQTQAQQQQTVWQQQQAMQQAQQAQLQQNQQNQQQLAQSQQQQQQQQNQQQQQQMQQNQQQALQQNQQQALQQNQQQLQQNQQALQQNQQQLQQQNQQQMQSQNPMQGNQLQNQQQLTTNQQMMAAGPRGPQMLPQYANAAQQQAFLMGRGGGAGPPRWGMMPRGPGPGPQYSGGPQVPPQGSALIAQLTQPPTGMGPQFQQINQQNANLMQMQQQQQQNQQQQQQVHQQQLHQQQQAVNQQQLRMQQAAQQQQNQQQQNQQQQQQNPQQQGVGPPGQQPMQNLQQARERHTIWQGMVEWIEKGKNPNDPQKLTRTVPCQVSANSRDGQPELKAEAWPEKLIMQLMPKQLIGTIGGAYLKNSKSVLFHPQQCEALEALTKVMSNGFAGCVHFTNSQVTQACDIKVLILLYTAEKNAYLGFIPNDQTAFVDRLRKVIQHQKHQHQNNMIRQSLPGGPGAPGGPGPGGPQSAMMNPGGPMLQPPVPPGGSASGLMQAMAGTQNNPSGAPGAPGPGMGPSPMMQPGPRGPATRAPYTEHMVQQAREQNLAKIEQLKKTLQAAQQQEFNYKTQMEISNNVQMQQQLHQNLEQAQQQENQFKVQLEMEQQKQMRAQLQQMQQQRGVGPQPQRMMRPTMTNNPGLRNLLQHQQPQQYRQQMMNMNQQQVQQQGQAPFDDVPSFEFLG